MQLEQPNSREDSAAFAYKMSIGEKQDTDW